MMKRLVDFLKRFYDLKPPDKVVEEEAKKIITEIFGAQSDCCKVSFRKPNLIVSSDSVFKNEFFLKKDIFLKKLSERTGNVYLNVLFK